MKMSRNILREYKKKAINRIYFFCFANEKIFVFTTLYRVQEMTKFQKFGLDIKVTNSITL